ncbi:hypothetical protein [Tsuneonella sp. HG222]
MSSALRAAVLTAGAALVAGSAMPATAQVSETIVVNILRECAKIDDPTARLACYDNNIRAAGGTPASIPGQMPAPSGGNAVIQPRGPAGFGSDDIRTPERFNPASNGVSQISTRVRSARERQPGTYLVELENGNQWLMSESVGNYRPPSRGDLVEIQRGAMGGYLMVFDNQQGVRVSRIK